MFNFVSSGKGGVSPRRRSLNRESGEEPCSESGAVPAAVSLFPCVGRSEQSLSPSGGGKTARARRARRPALAPAHRCFGSKAECKFFRVFRSLLSLQDISCPRRRDDLFSCRRSSPYRIGSLGASVFPDERQMGGCHSPHLFSFQAEREYPVPTPDPRAERRLFLEGRVRKRRKRASA